MEHLKIKPKLSRREKRDSFLTSFFTRASNLSQSFVLAFDDGYEGL